MSMSNELLSIISNITCNNNIMYMCMYVKRMHIMYYKYVTAYIVIIILKCKIQCICAMEREGECAHVYCIRI